MPGLLIHDLELGSQRAAGLYCPCRIRRLEVACRLKLGARSCSFGQIQYTLFTIWPGRFLKLPGSEMKSAGLADEFTKMLRISLLLHLGAARDWQRCVKPPLVRQASRWQEGESSSSLVAIRTKVVATRWRGGCETHRQKERNGKKRKLLLVCSYLLLPTGYRGHPASLA